MSPAAITKRSYFQNREPRARFHGAVVLPNIKTKTIDETVEPPSEVRRFFVSPVEPLPVDGTYDLIVEHNGDEIANVLGGEVRETPTTRPIELEVDLGLVELGIPLRRCILQHVPGYERILFRDVETAVRPLPETDQVRLPVDRYVPRQSPLHLGQREEKGGHLHILRRDEISALDVS